MTNRSDDPGDGKRQALLRLADAHAADVFASSRTEIMEDAASRGVDPTVVGLRMRDILDKAEMEVGKEALAQARAAIDNRAFVGTGVQKTKIRLRAANDAGLITMAARGLTEMSERDRSTVQEDFDEIAELLSRDEHEP